MNTETKVAAATETTETNAVVKATVINQEQANVEFKQFSYNGVDCITPEERADALRKNYRASVLRIYGVQERDAENKPLKNELIINGTIVKARIPKPLVDPVTKGFTETLPMYYERTKTQASGAYNNVLIVLERIDFLPQML